MKPIYWSASWPKHALGLDAGKSRRRAGASDAPRDAGGDSALRVQAHTAGLEVHVWTIDDPEEMRRLAALNVDAIMTDVPTLALEILGS